MPDTTNTRVCSKCGLDGVFRKGHRQCQTCERAYGRARGKIPEVKQALAEYRVANRAKYRKLNVEIHQRTMAEKHARMDVIKSAPCMDCHGSFPPYIMDFDHRNPADKAFEINAALYSGISWSRIVAEVAKCDVVCVRCHRLRTWVLCGSTKSSDPRKVLVSSLKNGPCKDCSGKFHYSQMDFDHVRGEKKGNVSHLSVKKILIEVQKCDLVCANCHRERTQRNPNRVMRNDPATLQMSWSRRSKSSHGLQTMVISEPSKGVQERLWHTLVGTMPDVGVARLGGTTPSNVHYFRKKMGIPVFRPQTRQGKVSHG